ncbi:L-fucose dehydrogenase [Aureimonas endophytica]|uniref:L-fucose dehydrogenase n=1 Tax=Aureimonas endophytica TaxID=2027858 RepID=A0A917E5C8_9HYPH|nr:aldo/keto reductase [Aureimonas endophytica]GGE02336.1 L-fucose dehydrogenase [Aureimonas endophytica]
MTTRRHFLAATALGALGAAALPSVLAAQPAPGAASPAVGNLPMNDLTSGGRWRPPHRLGLGGVPLGNGFSKVVADETAVDVMNAAWDAGVRLYDTSPFYGLGLSERRMGQVLSGKPRDEFVVSTKIGRVLRPDPAAGIRTVAIWADAPPFQHVFDYTEDGVRRSIEDSLQRLGLASLDIVYVHDLGPSTPDFPNNDWRAQFEVARTGAFPALARMRDEGLIKAWGLGLNEPESILAALEVADPDIILAASQYSLANHSAALDGIVPALQARGASIMVGTPLNGGFLAGKDRWNARTQIPPEMAEKRSRMLRVAADHGVDLRVAALQFLNANPTISSFVPGASDPDQVRQNAAAFAVTIPGAFWAELRDGSLIDARAPVPA